MAHYLLYSTVGCHLCEEAEALLSAWFPHPDRALEVRDIAGDDALVERYGVRIPVLQRVADGAELGWPFDADAVAAWLGAPAHAAG
ncbi:MAG: glutaredoxin family protein [Spongiibacteraceae bacterium]|jgi:hypothetical protein|nr:glutaredoxin family protein [Spongiibacteraceae bacterium]